MSLIHLEKQGDHWRSRVEGHFILGIHPIETLRKGLPEAMAQAVIDHCAMAGEDVTVFAQRLMAEIGALAPVKPESDVNVVFKAPEGATVRAWSGEGEATAWPTPKGSKFVEVVEPSEIANRVAVEPRRARVPRKAAAVAPEAEQAPSEPVAAPKEDI